MSDERSIHQSRGWLGTFVALFVFAMLGVFVWRVFFYARQIQSHQLSLDDLQLSHAVSTMSHLASQPVSDGDVDVAIANRPSLGSSQAPLTIVEFADFGCPYSRESSYTLRTLAAKYPDKVRFIYRDFPLTEIHPYAQLAAEAAACAGAQGKFWEYHDKLYQNQDAFSDGVFDVFAQQVNLRMPQFRSCMSSHMYAQQIAQDYKDGLAAGVRGTPTFFIQGARVAGAIPQSILEQVIQSVSSESP